MNKLQRPFDVLKKHLKEHHNFSFFCDVVMYEQEKDIFCFGQFFFDKRKCVYGMIDVHQKIIVYEISDYKRTQGDGFYTCSPIKSKLEQLTY